MKSLLISVVASVILIVGVVVVSRMLNLRLTTMHWIGISIGATVLLNLAMRARRR